MNNGNKANIAETITLIAKEIEILHLTIGHNKEVIERANKEINKALITKHI